MHRRTTFVAAAVLAIAGAQSASAQAPLVPHPTVGILAGVNLAKLSGDDITDASNRTGFVGGLYLTLHLAGGFGIEPEALYTMQGSKFKDSDLQVKLNYISVPVLLRYDFKTPGVHPYLIAGPTFSFKASCKESDNSDSVDCNDADFKPKSFDIGATGGAGIAFGKLSVSARYTAGFSKISEDIDAKNRTISVLAGLAF